VDPDVAREVSIVIPYGSGIDQLREQLGALSAQSYDGPAEVIVSDNLGSRPEIEALKPSSWPDDWELLMIDSSDVAGPSHARNAGWRASRGALILFCDSDDRVHETWLASMVAASKGASVLGGALEYAELNSADLLSWNSTAVSGLPMKFSHLPYSPSCNLGMTRPVLEALGGFDEGLLCGEDIDLCWRAAYAGHPIVFVPGAIVHYRLRASLKAQYLQAYRYGVDDALLLGRHRARGARWTLKDSVREFGSLGKAIILMPAGAASRKKATVRIGAWFGRIRGSVKHRQFVV
jgi:GT2 family glycosyltransferase